jgi:hypothetical protein
MSPEPVTYRPAPFADYVGLSVDAIRVCDGAVGSVASLRAMELLR